MSRPSTSPYRRVDQTTPAYREAVAHETATAIAQGKSAAEVEKSAKRRVTRQFVAAEKQRRLDLVAPLTAALTALDQPRGCWTYTMMIRTTRDGRTTVTVERFDPYQPEEKLWTLLSRDGTTPTEATQADYRRTKLRAWQKQQARDAKRKLPLAEQIRANALYTELETETAADPGVITYRFVREAVHWTFIGDLPRQRETYVVDTATAAVRRHETVYLGPSKILGRLTIEAFEQATDYGMIDPALPPFPVKGTAHSRYRTFAGPIHEETVEKTYSDYRRVKCYDDRFQAIPGELRPIDIVPGGE